MKLLALVFGDWVWRPYSHLIRWILISRGVKVGPGLYCQGTPRLTIGGRAQDIIIGPHCQIKGDVQIKNRERGQIIIGANCLLDHNVRLIAANQATLRIGDDTQIGIGSVINCGTGITIGTKSLISGYVYLQDSNHGTAPGTPIMDQALTYAPISIASDAWLGSHVSVLAGTAVGPGTVIGAHAVVTKDIPAHSIAVGIPAKVIRQR